MQHPKETCCKWF